MNIDWFLLFDGIYLIHLLLKALHLMEFGIIFLKFKSSIKSVLDLVEIRFKFIVFFGAFVQSNQSYQWHKINTKLSLNSNWYVYTKKVQIVCLTHSRHCNVQLTMRWHMIQMNNDGANGNVLWTVIANTGTIES